MQSPSPAAKLVGFEQAWPVCPVIPVRTKRSRPITCWRGPLLDVCNTTGGQRVGAPCHRQNVARQSASGNAGLVARCVRSGTGLEPEHAFPNVSRSPVLPVSSRMQCAASRATPPGNNQSPSTETKLSRPIISSHSQQRRTEASKSTHVGPDRVQNPRDACTAARRPCLSPCSQNVVSQ